MDTIMDTNPIDIKKDKIGYRMMAIIVSPAKVDKRRYGKSLLITLLYMALIREKIGIGIHVMEIIRLGRLLVWL